MVQNQIVEYAKNQLRAGVSEEAMRFALTESGWSATDIDDSLKNAKAAAPAPAVAEPAPAEPPKEKAAAPQDRGEVDILAKAGFTSPKMQNVLNLSSEKPKAAPLEAVKKTVKIGAAFDRKRFALPALAVLCVIFLGAAGYFFYASMSASSQVAKLNGSVSSLQTQLGALTAEKSDAVNANGNLQKKLDDAAAAKRELEDELSFFVVSPGLASSTTSALTTEVSGLVGITSRGSFTVTTALGTKITAENSKDQKVNDALKPLIGANADVTVTHLPGSALVTVIAVNGSSTVKSSE